MIHFRMRNPARLCLCLAVIALCAASPVSADEELVDARTRSAEGLVRVTIVKSGGTYGVQSVAGGGSASADGCAWSVVFAPDLAAAPYGATAGPQPHPEARFALLLCDGSLSRYVWISPDDVMDLDAMAQAEAQRYVEDVLVPDIAIGINPSARGLAGLRSWFWIDGFDGTVEAPPISAFGMSIDVRMSTQRVTWDFGDGTVEEGDLGRAYPEESTVQHAHQADGTYAITATIDLAPEYRVNGGSWLALPGLPIAASADHVVEQRQAVISDF